MPGRRAWAALVAVTGLAYAPGWGAPFHLDDRGVIVDDPRVHDLATAVASLPDGLRPLLRLTYAGSWALGLGPLGFQLVNLAIHVATVLLVGRLARLATGRADAAWLAAAGFALHPLATEAVAYASGRSASLSTLLVVASLVVWIEGTRAGSLLRVHGFAVVLAVAAALAKETAVLVPLAAAVWDRTVEGTPWRAVPRRIAGLLLVTVALGLGALLHDDVYRLLLAATGQRRFGDGLARTAEGVAYLATRLVRVDRLSIDPGLGLRPVAGASAVLGAGVLVAVAVGARRATLPAVRFGLAGWALHLVLPYAVLVRVDGLNERHAYLADVGLAVAAGAWLAPRLRSRRAWALAVAGLVGLGAATAWRASTYVTEVGLWEATVAASPDNPRAHHNLGVALERAGRRDEARVAYARALVRAPAYAPAQEGLRRVLRPVGADQP